jgi:hypothetical protein
MSSVEFEAMATEWNEAARALVEEGGTTITALPTVRARRVRA